MVQENLKSTIFTFLNIKHNSNDEEKIKLKNKNKIFSCPFSVLISSWCGSETLHIGYDKFKTNFMCRIDNKNDNTNNIHNHRNKTAHYVFLRETGKIIACKQMRRTGNSEETKRIVMDMDVVLKVS